MPAKKKTKTTKTASKKTVKKKTAKSKASAIKTASKKTATNKKKTTKKTTRKRGKAATADFNSKPIVLTPQSTGSAEPALRQSTSNLIAAVKSAQIAQDSENENRYDEKLDRRIIEGMLTNRDEIIKELRREGMNEADILRRSADLGISEALIRQVKGVAADLAGDRTSNRSAPASLAARNCLQCDRVFLSTGPGNRLCMRCRGGDAGLAVL